MFAQNYYVFKLFTLGAVWFSDRNGRVSERQKRKEGLCGEFGCWVFRGVHRRDVFQLRDKFSWKWGNKLPGTLGIYYFLLCVCKV